MANLLIPIIDQVMTAVEAFLDSGDAVKFFGDVFMPIFRGVFQLFSVVVPLLSKILSSFAQAGPTGESSFGKLFKVVGGVVGVVLELVAAIIDVLDTLGVFDALVFIIKLVGEGIGTVIGFVQVLVEWVLVAVEGLKKLMFWKKENTAASEELSRADTARAAQVQQVAASKEEAAARSNINNVRSTTINNNPMVTVNSTGPISPGSAPMVGDILARSISIDSARM
jgi:hypothetical protein